MEIQQQSIKKLRGRLMTDLGMSMAEWAVANGYDPAMVRKVVRRHIGMEHRTPTGTLTKEILGKLLEILKGGEPPEVDEVSNG